MTASQPLPLVSVIVPAYNAAATLAATLRSALAQSHAEIEIIVVDDGSADETARVARAIAAQDPRVTVARQVNAGVAAARNRALAMARGEFVAPLDADDLWHPAKLARQLARIREMPEATMVYCWSADIDADGLISELRSDVARFEGDVMAPLLVANFIDTSSVPLIRREALIAAGGWEEDLHRRNAQGCEDWVLYVRLAAAGPVLLEPAFLVGYRQSATAMSRDTGRMRRSMALVHEEAARRIGRLPRWVQRLSLADFDHYLGDILAESGNPIRAAGHRLRAVLRDPAWLGSRVARRRLKGWLTRSPAYPPVGGRTLHFDAIDADLGRFPEPDRWTRRRRARLAAARLAAAPHRD